MKIQYVKQFILIYDENDRYTTNCYNTMKEIMDLLNQQNDVTAIVINLNGVSPFFIKYGVLKHRSSIDLYFYDCFHKQLILK